MPHASSRGSRRAPGRREFLSELATPSYPARRRVEEPDSPLRTPFQRDRDRIVHSKAFRRLKHKTQVFIAPEGDHYRTRLTHTLEACGIARTVARALGLNEDLTEAIGLGHDLGHPPFGHIGEEALDAALRERCGARLQAQRALAAGGRRARARRAGPQPDRAGPRRHPQPHRLATSRRRWRGGSSSWSTASPTSTTTSTTPCGRGSCARRTCRRPRSSCSARPARRGSTRWCATSSTARAEAGDIVAERGGRRGDAAPAQVHVRPRLPGRGGAPRARAGRSAPLRGLFDHYMEHPEEVPEGEPGADECQRVADYLAGMTDRYCIARFTELTVPEAARF